MARTRTYAFTLLLFAASVGCAGDAADPGTQPSPVVTSFVRGVFDDLPRPPRSEPFGTRSEKGSIVARSYRATGISPTGVIDFYERVLAGRNWTVAEPVFRADTEARCDWVNDEWRLEVRSTSAQDRRNPTSGEVVTQFSLVLRPRL